MALDTEETKRAVLQRIAIGRRDDAVAYLMSAYKISNPEAQQLVSAIEAEYPQAAQIGQRVQSGFGGCVGIVFRVISAIFGFFAVALGFASGLLYFMDQSYIGEATMVTGVVTAFRTNETGGQAPIIEYLWDGELVYVESSTYSQPTPYVQGQELTIFVNPDKPGEVLIDSFDDRWLLIVILGSVAAFFLLITLVFFRIGKRLSRRPALT